MKTTAEYIWLVEEIGSTNESHSAKPRITADNLSLWGTSSIFHSRYNQVLHILEELLYFLTSQFGEFNILLHIKGFLNALH